MPDDAADSAARTETLNFRVTPEERQKVLRLASIEDRPYAELLREMGLTEIIRKHDRMVAQLSA